MIRLQAPAKINIFLTVGARRPDGLHELISVMQSVSLFDELTIEPASGFVLDVDPSGAAPVGDENLALRAARTFATMQGRSDAVSMTVHKRIPIAAGLAGGSTDAAAALVGVNELWRTGVSRKALERIGAGLGSDVPFCVRGGTAVVAGGGEELSSLAVKEPVWWVLGLPMQQLSTAAVYAEFDRLGGGRVDDPFEVADALARGDVVRLAEALRNDLQPAALSLAPEIAGGRDAMLEAGALASVLTGSGPTWLGLAGDEDHAREIAEAVAPAFRRVEVVRSLDRGPRILR